MQNSAKTCGPIWTIFLPTLFAEFVILVRNSPWSPGYLALSHSWPLSHALTAAPNVTLPRCQPENVRTSNCVRQRSALGKFKRTHLKKSMFLHVSSAFPKSGNKHLRLEYVEVTQYYAVISSTDFRTTGGLIDFVHVQQQEGLWPLRHARHGTD